MTLIRYSMTAVVALCLGSLSACSGNGGGDGDGDGDGDMVGDGDGDVIATSGGTSGGDGDAAAGGTTGGDGDAPGAGGDSPGTGGSDSGSMCNPFAGFDEGDSGFGVYAQDNASAGSLTSPAAGSVGGLVTADTTDGANGTSGSLHYAGNGFDADLADSGPGGIRFATDLTAACSDVSGVTGLRLYVKGTSDASAEWDGIAANTLIIFLTADIEEEEDTTVDYRLEMTADWSAPVDIPFVDFGMSGHTAGAVERIVIMIPGGGFDVWLDEIGFY